MSLNPSPRRPWPTLSRKKWSQGAYLTSTFFEQRRTLMQEWADFLSETMGPVIPT